MFWSTLTPPQPQPEECLSAPVLFAGLHPRSKKTPDELGDSAVEPTSFKGHPDPREVVSSQVSPVHLPFCRTDSCSPHAMA